MSKAYCTYRIQLTNNNRVQIEKIDAQHQSLGKPRGVLRYREKLSELIPLLQLVKDGVVNDSGQTRLLGELLFDVLFDDGLRPDFVSFYHKVVQQDKQLLRVELDIDEEEMPEVASLPWEFMCLPEKKNLGTIWVGTLPNLVLSRQRSQWNPAQPIQLEQNEKLRIALLVSAPSDLGSVAYENVQEVLETLASDQDSRVEMFPIVMSANPEAIDAILRKKPHIFHFIGHGRLKNESNQDVGQIALVDPDFGDAVWVDADYFSEFFNQHHPGIVMLQACEGATLSSSQAFVGLASRVVQQNIPVVIAMQYEVSNASAGRFAERFYQQLAEGDPVDIAAQDGRRAIAQGPTRYRKRDFATPVIWMRVSDGYLFRRQSDANSNNFKQKIGEINTDRLPISNFQGSRGAIINPSETIITQYFAPTTIINSPPFPNQEEEDYLETFITPQYSCKKSAWLVTNGVNQSKKIFDVVTTWGLQRGSFIGILTGNKDDNIYEELVELESDLLEASNKKKNYPSPLLIRDWEKFDLTQSSDEIFQVVEKYVLEETLSTEKPSHQGVHVAPKAPGIFLQVHIENKSKPKDEIVCKLCKHLVSFTSQSSIAIIIHITDSIGQKAADGVAKSIQAGLQSTPYNIPVERLELISRSQQTEDSHKSDRQLISKGQSMLAWLYQAGSRSGKSHITFLEKDQAFSNLNNFYQASLISGNLSGAEKQKKYLDVYESVSIQQVVEDLDSIANTTNREDYTKIYSQFLYLTEQYLSERTCELLKYCAKTTQSELKFLLLQFATSSDILMDAYVNGTKLDREYLPSKNDVLKIPEVLECFILSILRQRNNSTQKVKEAVILFWPILSGSLRLICDICLDSAVSEDEFLRSACREEIILAIRSGAKVERALSYFQDEGLDSYLPAWLVMASSLGTEQIELLLDLDLEQRSVFGLFTIEEEARILNDEHLKEKIMKCRGNRPICYICYQ
jgi:CHAT domain